MTSKAPQSVMNRYPINDNQSCKTYRTPLKWHLAMGAVWRLASDPEKLQTTTHGS